MNHRLKVAQMVPADATANHIGRLISRLALSECTLLDELYVARTGSHSVCLLKRRHKQFLIELMSFYCCACEVFLSEHAGNVEGILNSIVNEMILFATRDPFIAGEPRYTGDLVSRRIPRYRSHVADRLQKFRDVGNYVSLESVAARSAIELRQLLANGSAIDDELSALEVQLARRLEWTADELIGYR
jgi:hypothetical protein